MKALGSGKIVLFPLGLGWGRGEMVVLDPVIQVDDLEKVRHPAEYGDGLVKFFGVQRTQGFIITLSRSDESFLFRRGFKVIRLAKVAIILRRGGRER